MMNVIYALLLFIAYPAIPEPLAEALKRAIAIADATTPRTVTGPLMVDVQSVNLSGGRLGLPAVRVEEIGTELRRPVLNRTTADALICTKKGCRVDGNGVHISIEEMLLRNDTAEFVIAVRYSDPTSNGTGVARAAISFKRSGGTWLFLRTRALSVS